MSTLNIKISRMTDKALSGIANIHNDAFAGYMNSRIGKGYVMAFLRWFNEQNDSIALMAVTSDGEPCGYIVGAPLGYDVRMNKDLVGAAAKGMILRPWLVFDRQIRATVATRAKILFGREMPKQKVPDLPEPVISLVGIGTSSKVRGQGAGNALMTAFEEEAGKKKMTSMRLSVYPSNTVARKLYEKFGWTPLPEDSGDDSGNGSAMYYSKIL